METQEATSNLSLQGRALLYVKCGYAILPLTPRSKAPLGRLVPHGVKNATKDPHQIEEWWNAEPEANIGIATGEPSGDIFVLDQDPRNGGDESLSRLEQQYGKSLQSSVAVETGGGGRHFYFRNPKGVRLRNIADIDGLGFKSDGGYVVAPGSVHQSGQKYKLLCDRLPEPSELPDAPDELLDWVARARKKVSAASTTHGEIPSGQRNDTLFAIALRMQNRGARLEEIERELLEVNQKRCTQPLGEEEVLRIATSASKYQHYELTAGGNARRMLDLFGGDLRYCYDQKRWFVWDGSRWKPDNGSALEEAARKTVEALYENAVEGTVLIKHARRSDTKYALDSMIALAQPISPISSAELDSDPFLLNCLNGTIDLRTGRLRPHLREDYITKLCPVEFDPNARSNRWKKFLRKVTGGDMRMARFLQRAYGYSLTGDTGEEKLFFVFGPGGSGKSTFIEAVKAPMGDYAMTSDFEAFLKRKFVGGPRNDIARLDGARLVSSVEVEDGQQLAEAVVKQLTGGDTITARLLYKEATEFKPQLKLWLVANDPPQIRSTDGAIWRRILRLPFDQVIAPEDRDPKVKKILTNLAIAGPAILAWGVRGCLRWQEIGLKPPKKVIRSTNAYREEMDPLKEWIKAECDLGPGYSEKPGFLWESYSEWSDNTPEKLSASQFYKQLAARGFRLLVKRVGKKVNRVRVGISLKKLV